MNEFNDTLKVRRSVSSALAPMEIAVARERSVFDTMLTVAREKAETDAWLAMIP